MTERVEWLLRQQLPDELHWAKINRDAEWYGVLWENFLEARNTSH